MSVSKAVIVACLPIDKMSQYFSAYIPLIDSIKCSVEWMHPHYWHNFHSPILHRKKNVRTHLLQSVAILQHQFQLKLLMSFVCVSTLLAYTQQKKKECSQLWYKMINKTEKFHRHRVWRTPVDELNKNRLCPFRFFNPFDIHFQSLLKTLSF